MTNLAQIGLDPISPEQPSGAAVKQDADFERLAAEINRLHSLAGGTTNWNEVVDLGVALLKVKSKDMQVAGYLCLGLLNQQGYPGLASGLGLYCNMLETFWDTLYPNRVRGRMGAVEWLNEWVARPVSNRPPAESDRQAIKSCQELVDRLDRILKAKMGTDAPGLGKLRSAVQARMDSLPEPEPEAAKPPKPEATNDLSEIPVAPGAAAGCYPVIPGQTSGGQAPALRDTQQAMRQAALYLLEADLTNPLPYRIIRTVAWMEIIDLPPNQDGQTGIPPPAQAADKYKLMLTAGNWATLLPEAEAALEDNIFWLDLQYYVWRALESAGAGYKSAQRVVSDELAALLRRLPGVPGLSFSNGMPFADAQTRQWIQNGIMLESAAARPAPDARASDPLADITGQARQLAGNGEIKQALALFQKGLQTAVSRREAFAWKVQQARLCLECGFPQLAFPLLEALDEEIRHFHLEDWEPNLAAEVIGLLINCGQKLSQAANQVQPDLALRLSRYHARLCRINPVMGLEIHSLSPEGSGNINDQLKGV